MVVVHRKVQFQLLFWTLIYLVSFALILGAALFLPLVIDLTRPESSSTSLYDSAVQMLYLHNKFWPIAGLIILACGLHSIVVSHKIAGPLYRLQRVFDQAEKGVLPGPITLRKGDYLHEEAKSLNRMFDSFRSRSEGVRKAGDALNRSVYSFIEKGPEISREDLIDQMEVLSARTRAFEKVLWRTESE
jgi:hypothetical protein